MKNIIFFSAVVCILASCSNVDTTATNADSTQGNFVDTSTMTWERDESITQANAYSDLFLDSAAIDAFIQKQKISGGEATALRRFYTIRNNQFAWFASDGLTEQGRGLWSIYAEEGNPDKNLKEHMDTLLQHDTIQIDRTDTSYVQKELLFTRQLMNYAQKNKNGIINTSNFYFVVPTKKQEPLQLADSILNNQKVSNLYANNKAYNALKQQLSVYYNAAKNGNWPRITGATKISKGTKSPVVTAIKKRLAATNDYNTTDTSNVYTDTLATAIKDFQLRNGLAPTGNVNDSLINVLNTPAEQRIQQIIVNMNRMLWLPVTDSNHLLVNIPSFMLYAHEGSNRVFEMPVIVGQEGTSTLMFSGEINQIVFNPTWNVPRSIVQNEILPKMKSDPKYLEKKNMEIVNKNDSIPTIRQLPGKENALGKVKFLFPNTFDIYLHDTPDKNLFKKKDRALSHGCIRVADPNKLAQYLLRDQSDWSAEKINSTMNSGKEQKVEVKKNQPVYITYYTAWIDEKGKLNFRNDVYQHDKKTMSKMFLTPRIA